MRLQLLLLFILVTASCGSSPNSNNVNINSANRANAATPKPAPVPVYTYEIVNTYPHDPRAFTQGLVYHDGYLYEGTGGKQSRGDDFTSSLRKVDLKSGKVLQKYELPPEYFGEGIALLNDQIYQLTWQEGTAFVYSLGDFKLQREFKYAGDGWGLTEDGAKLYMSDGTHIIRIVDPETFRTTGTITVNDERGKPLMNINELEWVKGEIWANVWQTGWIIRIDPATGKLLGRIDLNDLAEREMDTTPNADVLNGIAYDEAGDRIFVTGKMWRRLFEIKLSPGGAGN